MLYTVYLRAEDRIERVTVEAEEGVTLEKARFSAQFVHVGDAVFRFDHVLGIVPESAGPK
jgi:hypothetical protein